MAYNQTSGRAGPDVVISEIGHYERSNSTPRRHTVITYGPVAMKELELTAARERKSGRQILTIGHAAARLAGGFATPATNEALREAIYWALRHSSPGELKALSALPGATSAVMATLRKAWLAGIDLRTYQAKSAPGQQRVAEVALLEEATKAQLPPSMLVPPDLLQRALERLRHAPRVLGRLSVQGVLDLMPVWRPLMLELAKHVHVEWHVVGSSVPSWLVGTNIEVFSSPVQSPELSSVSTATAYDEAVEAMRWMRELLATGKAQAHEIAIATVNIEQFDNYFLSLRDDSTLPLHFVHGVPVTTTWAGQAAAALADVLARGPSQSRLRRLARFQGKDGILSTLPERWTRVLPASSPLDRPESWDRFLNQLTPEDWPDEQDATDTLRTIVTMLSGGRKNAAEAGERVLTGLARKIWRQARAEGPDALIDQTLANMRQVDDQVPDPTNSVCWMPASQLSAAPRAHVRLLGLNSGSWPRSGGEDPLLPDHIISAPELEPLPTSQLDRRHFRAILETTTASVVLSQARHGSEGRQLVASPLFADELLKDLSPLQRLKRHRVPEHAFSNNDRLNARPEDFQPSAQARSSKSCWTAWHSTKLTPHDGLVRADHPLVLQSLERRQSASSLRRLLRQPIGFVWRYGLGITDADEGEESLVLDNLAFGSILHQIVNESLIELREHPEKPLETVVEAASSRVAEDWLVNEHTPPKQIWDSQLNDLKANSVNALEISRAREPYTRYWTEVPFGGEDAEFGREDSEVVTDELPWEQEQVVTIPNTGFTIGGRIDRLDLDADGSHARVIDYKTGRLPSKASTYVLDGGRELQRSLYTFAVRQLLGPETTVEASLVYPKEARVLKLADPDAVITALTDYLVAARTNLEAGRALPGKDTSENYEAHALALPAFPKSYWDRKAPAVTEALGVCAEIWDEK